MLTQFDIFKDDQNDCYQVRTKSNSFTLEFDDEEKEGIFLAIIAEVEKKPHVSHKELKLKVGKKADEAKVLEVINLLSDYQLLSFDSLLSGVSDVFSSQQKSGAKDFSLLIFSESELGEKMKVQAQKESIKKVKKYSFNRSLKSIESLIEKCDFILVDANEWSPYYTEIINEFALKYNKPWLYVGGVEETSIKIGPLFYGQETGCYHCLISRVKSNHEYPTHLSAYEEYLKEKKISSKADTIPNSDTVYNVIANLAMLEVMKFIEEWALPSTWRAILKVDITDCSFSKHTLLKKPFCEVCKPELKYNPAPWLEAITLN